jgi:preprotein translocase SecE subunit
MAGPENRRRKPRIRKVAPTVREMAQEAQSEARKSKRRRLPIRGLIRRPFAALARTDNRLTRALGRILRPLRRILVWLVPRYFINSWRELKLVTWPGRRETWRLTGAVFVFAIVFGIMITGVDKVIDRIFKELVIK